MMPWVRNGGDVHLTLLLTFYQLGIETVLFVVLHVNR